MKNKLLFFVLAAFLLPSLRIFSQENNLWITNEKRQELISKHPEVLIDEKALEDFTKQFKESRAARSGPYVIPVVFHIIHRGGGVNGGNISDAQVLDQIRIMNEDYQKRNPDTALVIPAFRSTIGDMNVEFRLPTIDPYGNPTTGIEHIWGSQTYGGSDYCKLNPWPREKYVNVWLFTSFNLEQGAAGFAYEPGDVNHVAEFPMIDGVNILNQYIGSFGTGRPAWSRALTHEIGHCFNLQHTWGNTNNPEVACGDDDVNDTPITQGHTGCDTLDFKCDSQALNIVYPFDHVTTSSGTVDPTTPPVQINLYFDTTVHASSFSANGVSANSTTAGSFGFSDWATGANDGDTAFSQLTGTINPSKYYEFTITPVLGQAMTLRTITFNVKRNGTGVRTFVVRSSLSSFNTNLLATVAPANPLLKVQTSNTFYIAADTTATFTGAKINLTGILAYTTYRPVTFRIYGYNAEDSTGTFEIDSVAVKGIFGTIENTQNFMEYSYCSVMFTNGQADRVHACLNSNISERDSLWSQDNLAATGTDQPNMTCTACLPIVDFDANNLFACKGTAVKYSDDTYNINAAPRTSRSWDLPGSDSLTSTDSTVAVHYNTPGVYPVTLTVSNANGTVSKTMSLVTIMDTTNLIAPYYTGFENQADFNYWWGCINDDRDTAKFQYCSTAGRNQSKSVLLNTYRNRADYNIDELVSPPFDCSGLSSANANLTFWYTFATWDNSFDFFSGADYSDSMVVYAQSGCSGPWVKIYADGTNSLFSAGFQDGYYIPGADQIYWKKVSATIPTNQRTRGVRFRVVLISSHQANNFYLDDWNVGFAASGIEETSPLENVSIMPNPFTSTVRLTYLPDEQITYELRDITGRLLQSQQLIQSDNTAEIDMSGISSQGMYLLTLKQKNSVKTFRLIKE